VTTWLAIIVPSAVSLVAALLGVVNHAKLTQVHVLVNSRLDTAVQEIADLKQQRDIRRADEGGERLQP
jgi:hypothetical protein